MTSAVWTGTSSEGPRRICARPGCLRGILAAAGESITSLESWGVCTRRQTRRFVLARMFSLTAPDGRCVARIMCTPRLRPRWAMPTSDGTKSGSSAARVANSSMITISRGSGADPSVGDEPVVLDDVRGAVLAQHPLAVAQLGLEAEQGALTEVLVEVGDHADGVGQLGALGERAAALVVDQHEVDPRRAVLGGQRGDQAAQQLGLAGAGGAGDQAVGTVGHEVDVERAVFGQRERRHQLGAVLAAPPALLQLGGVGLTEAQQGGQRDVVG